MDNENNENYKRGFIYGNIFGSLTDIDKTINNPVNAWIKYATYNNVELNGNLSDDARAFIKGYIMSAKKA